MFYATSYYLNKLISEAVSGSIELFRQSKNTIYFDGDSCVNPQEIRDFIFSTPYFSFDLKEFLFTCDYSVFVKLTEGWMHDFLEKTYLWANSEEWLFYDVKYICEPFSNRSPDRKELDLCLHNKAIFYCQRFS